MRFQTPLAAAIALLAFIRPVAAGDDKAAKPPKLVRYTEEETVEQADGLHAEGRTTIYSDLKAVRERRETSVRNFVLLRITDKAMGRMLMTNPEEKTATLLPVDPRITTMLEGRREFYEKSGGTRTEEELEGRKVVKYARKEKGRTCTLWVDAKTKLPVREEMEVPNPPENPNIKLLRYVWSGFEWDPALPIGAKHVDDLFRTDPPAGYALEDKTAADK
jgi:hypothetical protein